MKKQITKHQHWNPRMHLKHFARKGKIYVYDKKTEIIDLRPIKKAAVGKWFYDRDNIIEDKLGEIEGKVDKIFLKIINTKQINSLTVDERKSLDEFIVLQDFRTPKSRIHLEIMSKETLKLFINAIKNDELDESLIPEGMPKNLWKNMPPPKENFVKFLQMIKEDLSYLNDFTKDSAKRSTIMVLNGFLPKSIEIFSNLKLRLFKNESNIDFFTSDHPVCRYNHYMMDARGSITPDGIGYNSEGIQFFYPLTPKLCIVFEDPMVYHMYKDVSVVDHEFVDFINARIIQNSTQWIYSQTNNFIYVDEYLQKYPHFKDPDILFGLWKISKNDLEY